MCLSLVKKWFEIHDLKPQLLLYQPNSICPLASYTLHKVFINIFFFLPFFFPSLLPFLFLSFLPPSMWESYFPNQGLNLQPLHWKRWVLTNHWTTREVPSSIFYLWKQQRTFPPVPKRDAQVEALEEEGAFSRKLACFPVQYREREQDCWPTCPRLWTPCSSGFSPAVLKVGPAHPLHQFHLATFQNSQASSQNGWNPAVFQQTFQVITIHTLHCGDHCFRGK